MILIEKKLIFLGVLMLFSCKDYDSQEGQEKMRELEYKNEELQSKLEELEEQNEPSTASSNVYNFDEGVQKKRILKKIEESAVRGSVFWLNTLFGEANQTPYSEKAWSLTSFLKIHESGSFVSVTCRKYNRDLINLDNDITRFTGNLKFLNPYSLKAKINNGMILIYAKCRNDNCIKATQLSSNFVSYQHEVLLGMVRVEYNNVEEEVLSRFKRLIDFYSQGKKLSQGIEIVN